MKLERVHTTPDNYAPFLLSQGIRFGNLLFVSGQAPAKTAKSSRAASASKLSRHSRTCNGRWRPAGRVFGTSSR
ncbi:hypothetical protein GCM10007893_14520 [Paracoccus marinus]|nr:hypothetical protein GCM10007893_14520 [Paracoccus marinus]